MSERNFLDNASDVVNHALKNTETDIYRDPEFPCGNCIFYDPDRSLWKRCGHDKGYRPEQASNEQFCLGHESSDLIDEGGLFSTSKATGVDPFIGR